VHLGVLKTYLRPLKRVYLRARRVLMPYCRPVELEYLRRTAEGRACKAVSVKHRRSDALPPCFIIGCGRSGTSILGKALQHHPDVCYLREPIHLWAAIDRRTDVTHLHYRLPEARFIMDASHSNRQNELRFGRLILGARDRLGARIVIEKTPHNAARIGFIESLVHGALYLHIVRDGVDVTRSINRLATTDPFKLAHQPRHNTWWGNENSKWKALARDGVEAGYFPGEIAQVRTHAAKGAYEWLVSLGEVDRWRARLGERLREVRYDDFTSDPAGTLGTLCAFVGISCPQQWLDRVVGLIDAERRNHGQPLRLPPRMCREFNRYQERYGFGGRAEPCRPASP
jgi:hypothetical protein